MSYNVNEYAPGSGKLIKSDGSVVNVADAYTSEGKLKVDIGDVDVSLTASDIQIGAVEIKNGQATTPADAYRMTVNSDGSIPIRIVGSINGGVFGP